MKSYFVLAILFISNAILGRDVSTDVAVKEATVYLKGAKIQASTQVYLAKGKNLVRIEKLPNDLNVNTLSVKLPSSVDMMSIQPERHVNPVFEPDTEEIRLEAEIVKKQKEIELLDIQVNILRSEKNILQVNTKIEKHEKYSNIEQLEKLLLLYSTKLLAIEKGIFELNQQREAIQTSINEIQTKIQKRRPTLDFRQYYDVVLELESSKDQSSEIELSYLVQNAGWIPSYDVRAMTSKKSIELSYKCKIYQNTGQEWNNVKLSVSSYRPNLNTQRPILHPMYVMEFVPQAARVTQMSNAQAMDMTNSYQFSAPQAVTINGATSNFDVKLDEQLAEPVTWQAVTDSPLTVIYELNKKHSIPSKPEAQHLMLDKKTVDADYVYHTVPTLSTEVHLLAKIKNWNSLNLMGGEAFLFLGDNFVGQTVINSNYAADELPIALGVDERIVVKRTRLNDESETKKRGDDEVGVHNFEITFRNNLNFEITLEVLDQIPVSKSPKIVISEEEYGTAEYNKTTGSLLWTNTLAAGASGKVNFTYKVTYPKGLQIIFKRS